MTISSHDAIHSKTLPLKQADQTSTLQDPTSFRKQIQTAGLADSPTNTELFSFIEEDEEEELGQEIASSFFYSMPMSKTEQLNAALNVDKIVAPTYIPKDLEILFENIASLMLIQDHSHETQMAFTFEKTGSLLNGTHVMIQEFNTAPRVFNVVIASHTAAIIAIEKHKEDLLKAFEAHQFHFSIHRIETHLQHTPYQDEQEG